jgi:hypothetical protein
MVPKHVSQLCGIIIHNIEVSSFLLLLFPKSLKYTEKVPSSMQAQSLVELPTRPDQHIA